MNYTIISDIHFVDKEAWIDFIEKHPNGNIFHSYELYESYQKVNLFEPLVLFALDNDKKIVGCLFAVIHQEFKGSLRVFTSRSIIHGGPLAKDNDAEIINALLIEYNKIVKRKAIYSQFRNLFDVSELQPFFLNNGYVYEPHLDIHINLTKSVDDLKSKISKNKRRNISKSLNKGTQFLEIQSIEEYEECIKLVQSTYKRIGLPCPDKSFFMLFFSELVNKKILKVFIASIQGKIIATRMELCFKEVVYDWYAGADDNYSSFYPNDFVIYHILLWGHENGYKTFDFGGAGKPGIPYGVRDHKMKFGGDLVEYGRYLNIHKPFLYYMGIMGLKCYKIIKHGIFYRKK